jgi:hypothetical protein
VNDDPVKSYQDALQKYQTATNNVESLVASITGLAKIMKEWQEVRVADGKTQFPVGVGKYTINPKDFPTIQQVAETLSAWHQVRHQLNNKWNSIPRERQIGLQPPP